MSQDASSTGRLLALSQAPDSGPYVLQEIVVNVPLSRDGSSAGIRITCVEVLDGNLYVGTSASEILHFVSIPPEDSRSFDRPSYILASRLNPASNVAPSASSAAVPDEADQGVQQILLLPAVDKACVLCNGVLSFYTLPELSPAFANTKPLNCTWVGGVDQNLAGQGAPESEGVIVMICAKSRIRLVRLGEEPRKIRDIEFGGCLAAVRRGNLACVADAHNYALLDVIQQQKIHLFPISSLDEQAPGTVGGRPEDISSSGASDFLRSGASAGLVPTLAGREDRGHARSTSLGALAGGLNRGRRDSPRPTSAQWLDDGVPDILNSVTSLAPSVSPGRQHEQRSASANRRASPDQRVSPPPAAAPAIERDPSQQAAKQRSLLKPHIVTLTSTEFLLTTGTTYTDPGVGMFVNSEGDVVRGTLEFSSYPDAIVVDGQGPGPASSHDLDEPYEESHVLAIVRRDAGGTSQQAIEVQRLESGPQAEGSAREWISLDQFGSSSQRPNDSFPNLGLRTVTSGQVTLPELGFRLRSQRLNLTASKGSDILDGGETKEHTDGSDDDDDETRYLEKREQEEIAFMSSLCRVNVQTVVWSGANIYWALRNPLTLRIEAQLTNMEVDPLSSVAEGVQSNREGLHHLIENLKGLHARTEAEFLGLNYVRQKSSLLLFLHLLRCTFTGIIVEEHEKLKVEEALISGEIDPRILMAFIPTLQTEICQSRRGIWAQAGLKEAVEFWLPQYQAVDSPTDPAGPFGRNVLQVMKRYLASWRRKKGFGSVADETEVFQSVDAALLRTLLLLDTLSPQGPAVAGSVRAELNAVVHQGVECFERAISLLEDFKRLYVLSRLYQSRKMSARVLSTWKRIIEGETDLGGEFTDGEHEVRKYLSRIKDSNTVGEYGAWLANRNPSLGVQVFADPGARVKFEPSQAVRLLQRHAPKAVKHYLEYLVFAKQDTRYANDLVLYYLDTVLGELAASEDSRSMLLQSYESYRALRPPKPTYRQFVTDNGVDTEWWHSRLRLLHLLGNKNDPASNYDTATIFDRIQPYRDVLVPEMIILSGRQGRHEEAISLLTHGLGDYDTAIRYCLLGGSSIFLTASGFVPQDMIPSREDQAMLLGYLLREFLRVEDVEDRIERTSELLERFGSWFDIIKVLDMIPDTWSIELLSAFLVTALRGLVKERSESTVTKALNGAQNLKTGAHLIDSIGQAGPRVERAK